MTTKETTDIKTLLQVCADIQDGLWEAAAHARNNALPSFFQRSAVQWNAFADQLFSLLLALDHTSPDTKWRANADRTWMNPTRNLAAMDDLAICDECVRGLKESQELLQNLLIADEPRISQLAEHQLAVQDQQRDTLEHFASSLARKTA